MNPPSCKAYLSAISVALGVLAAFPTMARATVLTFETSPLVATGEPMPQDYDDNVSGSPMTAANPSYQNLYDPGAGRGTRSRSERAKKVPGEIGTALSGGFECRTGNPPWDRRRLA